MAIKEFAGQSCWLGATERLITIHMPQRTSKILLVRLTANRKALLFLIRVTSFARYTV